MGSQYTRSDDELLAAHVAGDRYAFEELFHRHRRHLHRVARRASRCREDADDALQEAMLSAHRFAGGFRYHCAVSSWLHRIVVNASMDRLRQSMIQATEPLCDRVSDGDHTAAVEAALAVRDALRRLPVEQRTAVVAVDLRGYSIADAARAIGVAEGTVKSRCARGRARLAVLLGQFADGSPAPGAAPAGRIPLAARDGRIDDCA
ncbi:RNA polymerase sigma factor SigM [Mycobacterium sp. M1]|uniref:RNA polymerase sigma factor SigM n=1 Tax=Mycolicibacter acidiphilus TaxID=2835306 RepID=A0ABS5RHJ9_9MYCO|nr:RNA polymerase sigma factor SigM [Mycolicibacter acidiphilus]MBS9533775.1 RNA polymerase sigma factor SigM [Mycolicibacter acidiphilus]